jgi:membrane fusion protein, multidrug efflux system
VAAVTVAGLAVAASLGFGWHGQSKPPAAPAAQSTVTVVKREDLAEYATLDAQVSYGAGWALGTRMPGVVTWLPATGTVIRRGQALMRVNDAPVVLLYGNLPAYRQLQVGATGNDVREFEENLRSLGYLGFTVDETFSQPTANAVKRWQKDLGLPESGTVEPDRILYADGALRVAANLVRPGAPAPADVLTVTDTTKVVTASVDSTSTSADWAAHGVAVSIVLPSGKTVPGTVSSVGQPANSAPAAGDGSGAAAGGGAAGAGDGASKTQVVVTVADQAALPAGGGGVSIRHTDQERRGVLTVPVTALLALAEGGYGLDVVASGQSRIVAVTVGMFSGGRVEVSGPGLRPGTEVRMPA